MRAFIVAVIVCSNISLLQANENVRLYSRNYNNEFVKTSIDNLIANTTSDYGEMSVVQSRDMEQGEAFEALVRGEIDIFVGSPTKERESKASMIYVPLDRGLLGFRLCLVHEDAPLFSSIRTPSQFIQKKLSIGLGTYWPDRIIYEQNGFNVVDSPIYQALFSMLENRRFDCFSRSVIEVDNELTKHADKNITLDEKLVFIYPNADFIFVNPNKTGLLMRLMVGMENAIEDGSYYEIFDTFFSKELAHHKVFERKLIFIDNDSASQRTIEAINRYGIASFIIPETLPKAAKN